MTGLILKIDGIEDAVALEFYIERDRAVRMLKGDLTRVFRGGKTEYFAFVDTDRIGRGNLICRVEFVDHEAAGDRPVVVSGFTGYMIPCMGQGQTITAQCLMGYGATVACGDYKVAFEAVEDIPKNDGTCVFCGLIKTPVADLMEVKQDAIKELLMLDLKPQTVVLEPERGDKVLVAIPYDWRLKAYKDDGAGVPVEFGNSVMNANGEYTTVVDGVEYRIYGEFFLIGTTIKLYIE